MFPLEPSSKLRLILSVNSSGISKKGKIYAKYSYNRNKKKHSFTNVFFLKKLILVLSLLTNFHFLQDL